MRVKITHHVKIVNDKIQSNLHFVINALNPYMMAFDPNKFDGVLKQICSGMSLKMIFGESAENGKNVWEFYAYLNSDASLIQSYRRAQEARAEVLADEVISISDEERDAQRARNRIDARKWYASKMQPQKYGDRLDLNITQPIDISFALAEAKRRAMLPSCDPHLITDAEVIETKQLTDGSATGSQPVEELKPQQNQDATKEWDEILS